MTNIQRIMTDIKDYQYKKSKKRYANQLPHIAGLNLDELDSLILRFNQMIKLCEKQNIDIESDIVNNSYIVNHLSKLLCDFNQYKLQNNSWWKISLGYIKKFLNKASNLFKLPLINLVHICSLICFIIVPIIFPIIYINICYELIEKKDWLFYFSATYDIDVFYI